MSPETDSLTMAVDAIDLSTAHAERDPIAAAEKMTDQELADYIAAIQDIRSRLGGVERELTTALGHRLGKVTSYLTDGRQFELGRSQDRKEWDHDSWKRDARRAVIKAAMEGKEGLVLMDTETGEAVDNLAAVLYQAVTQAQEVHGSTAPRSRALKLLGLYASDYCTSTPAGWRFTALKPTTKEDTNNG